MNYLKDPNMSRNGVSPLTVKIERAYRSEIFLVYLLLGHSKLKYRGVNSLISKVLLARNLV